MPRPFVVHGQRVVLRTPIFELEARDSENPRTGARSDYYVLRSPDWVNVVAETVEGQVVLVRQWRHGVALPTLEIPGGLLDPGEDPVEAALRELREETGFASDDAQLIGRVHPNPALLDNVCHTVWARGCRQVGEPQPDAGEDLETVLADAEALRGWTLDGTISHAVVICGIHAWLSRRG